MPRKFLSSVSVFRRRTVYHYMHAWLHIYIHKFIMCSKVKHLDQSYRNGVPKSVFRKATPQRKIFNISLRNDSCGHRFTYSCQVSWKSVKQKSPNRCVVFLTEKKSLEFYPSLDLTPLECSRRQFCRVALSPLSIPLPSFVHLDFRDIYAKMSFTIYNIGV